MRHRSTGPMRTRGEDQPATTTNAPRGQRPAATSGHRHPNPEIVPRQREHVTGIRVRATALGFYHGRRRRPGDEFTIRDVSELGAWMELVQPGTSADDDATETARREHVRVRDEATPPPLPDWAL